jgi:hypothetical protein
LELLVVLDSFLFPCWGLALILRTRQECPGVVWNRDLGPELDFF